MAMSTIKYIMLEDGTVQPAPNDKVWFEYSEIPKRRVARTELHNANVSTVFLGLDHRWGEGPPILFESLDFDTQDMERYSTRDEAMIGHYLLVAQSMFRTHYSGPTFESIADAFTDSLTGTSWDHLNEAITAIPSNPVGPRAMIMALEPYISPFIYKAGLRSETSPPE